MQNQPVNPKTKKKRLIKHRLDAVFALFFFGFIVVLGFLFLILPKKGESVIEQRKLAEKPKFSLGALWNGTYTAGIRTYVADNFAFRDDFVKAKFALEDLRGVRLHDVRIYSAENDAGEETLTNEKTSDDALYNADRIETLLAARPVQTPTPLAAVDLNDPYYADPARHFSALDKTEIADKFSDYMNMDKEELVGEQRGALFVIGDTALEIFYGNEKASKDYAAAVNAYADALGSGVTVYNMVIPNHFEFGLPNKYKGTVGRDEKPYLDLIRDNLSSAVVSVDIYDTMKKHYAAGEYLYFRTDHHWTGLGAYRAYEKFCEYAGFAPIPLESYEKRTTTGFLGTLYASSMDKNLAANPDTVDYYVIDVPYEQTNTNADGVTSYKGSLLSEYKDGRTNGYLTFMSGDIPLATIETENKNGRKIIIFKESYGNAFAPFLVPHYETVYVADIRSFPYNAIDFIRENGITDVMILNNIMSANTPARIANILELMTK